MTLAETAAPGADVGAGRARVVVALSISVTTGYGILYYAFPVLAPAITADTGWSPTTTFAAFTLSQLVAAVVGVPLGRVLDRHGPRWVMTLGALTALPALVLVATAQSLPVFYAGWIGVGVAGAATLYPPAFTAITRWYGPDRVPALMALTLTAGFASTLFAPLAAAIFHETDWRRTYLVLALLFGVVAVPAHGLGLRRVWPTVVHKAELPTAGTRVWRSVPFLALAVAFSLGAVAAYAAVFNLIPLLLERGYDTRVAAVALGLGGVGQVLGRLGYLQVSARTGAFTRTVAILALTATATAVLGVVASVTAIVAAAVAAGLARGLLTLVEATAVSDRWGTEHYGRLNAIMTAPVAISAAFAPWLGAATAAVTGSYSSAFLVFGALGAAGAVVALFATPARHAGDLRAD